jgi:hypothetical protein
MFNIFSTSCSYEPKEYNPEHEVFLKGTLATNKTGLNVGTKKKFSLPPPPPNTPHLNGWGHEFSK